MLPQDVEREVGVGLAYPRSGRRQAQHVAAAEYLDRVIRNARAVQAHLFQQARQSLVAVATIRRLRQMLAVRIEPCRMMTLRQNEMTQPAEMQGRMPQRDRHAGAEQRLHLQISLPEVHFTQIDEDALRHGSRR